MAAMLLVTLTSVGVLIGMLLAGSTPRYTAGAVVLITGTTNTAKDNLSDEERLYAVGRYVLARLKTWALVAQSDAVTDAAATTLGEPRGALRGAVEATATTATSYLDIVVEAPQPAQAVRRAEAVASATVSAITAQEDVRDAGGLRVTASVISVDSVTQDQRWLAMRMRGVLGGTLGLLAGWLVLALRRQDGWVSRLGRPLPLRAHGAELQRMDQMTQFEVLGALLMGQSARGALLVALGVAGIFGYGVTGSPVPPLVVVLVTGVAAIKDLRFAAVGIMYAAVTVFPPKVDIVDLGLLTPTVLEVAIAIGVLLMLRSTPKERLAGPFTGPVLGLVGALFVGAVVGKLNGATVSELFSHVRLMVTVLSFFVIREAFRGRPYQLLAAALVMAAVASVIEVIAVPLNLGPLLSSGGSGSDYVITGSETYELARLDPPVLQLLSVVLVIVAAGVIRLRPRWLWGLVLIPCLVLEALSFTRTTWVSLVALSIVVASLRGGSRALITRAAAVVAVGVLAFGTLQTGLLGPEAQAVAARVTSIATGEALESDSLADRLRENAAADKTLAASPFVGTGLALPYGAELVSFDSNLGVNVVTPRAHIHNQFLRIWLWMGVVGLIAYGWLGVRVVAFAYHDRMRRGRVSTLVVASAFAIVGLAVQLTLAPNLNNPATIISIAIALAVMELSAASTGAESSPRTDAQRGAAKGDRRPVSPELSEGVLTHA